MRGTDDYQHHPINDNCAHRTDHDEPAATIVRDPGRARTSEHKLHPCPTDCAFRTGR